MRRVGLAVVQSGRARLLHYDTGRRREPGLGAGAGLQRRGGSGGAADRAGGGRSVRRAAGSPAAARPRSRSPTRRRRGRERWFPAAGRIGPAGRRGRAAARRRRSRPRPRQALQARRSDLQVVDGRQVFTEVLLPPPRLLVCGAGDDAPPLVSFAAAVGFRVVVADHRPAYLTAPAFSRGAASCSCCAPNRPRDELPTGPRHPGGGEDPLVRARPQVGGAAPGIGVGLPGPARSPRPDREDPGRACRPRSAGGSSARSASTWAPTGPSRWRSASCPSCWRSGRGVRPSTCASERGPACLGLTGWRAWCWRPAPRPGWAATSCCSSWAGETLVRRAVRAALSGGARSGHRRARARGRAGRRPSWPGCPA